MSGIADETITCKEAGSIGFNVDPPGIIEIDNGAGKKAVIDFSGDSVTYSGELTVEESAQLFFNAVFSLFAKT